MDLFWYTLRSKPNKEDALYHQASASGFEVFYPRIKTRPVNPRARTLCPYFPGYMFVHVDLLQVGHSEFAWMPYSQGLIGFDGEPACVPGGLIQAIRRRVDAINAVDGEILEGLKPGEHVTIQAGPFLGYEAIFDGHLHGAERVRVLLKLLSKQQVSLELPVGQLERKKRY
jgi:transcription antitermination factor NusG